MAYHWTALALGSLANPAKTLAENAFAIINTFFTEAVYEAKMKDLKHKLEKEKEALNEAQKESEEAKMDSDGSAADFRVRLEQYRRSEERELQLLIRRVRDSRGEAGSDDKEAGRYDRATERSSEDSGRTTADSGDESGGSSTRE